LKNSILCTCKMARKLYPDFKKYDLGTVTQQFGIVNESRHRAAGDAAATAEVFINMLKMLPENKIYSFETLLDYV